VIERAAKRALEFELVRYALSGSTAVGVMMLTLAFLVEIVGVPKVTASMASLTLAVMLNYFLQYYFTFRDSHGHAKALWRFLVVTSLTMGMNYVLFSFLADRIHYGAAQMITLLIIFLVNFVINRAFTFKTASA